MINTIDPQKDRQSATSTLSASDAGVGYSILPKSPGMAKAVLAFLALIALVSLAIAIWEALRTGTDFQWSGAHLVSQHIDPWKVKLDGDPNHLIKRGQIPNYLHELYICLLPVGYLTLQHALAVWCLVNLMLLGATIWLLRRFFRLDRMQTVLLTLLMLASTPFRMTMSNGQHGIFILFLMTLTFYVSGQAARGIFLGLSCSKYSFSPLLVFFQLFKGRVTLLVASALPPVIGLLLVWYFVRGNLLTLALEPFKLSRVAVGLGYADIMTPVEILLRNAGYSAQICYVIPSAIGMLAALILAAIVARSKGLTEQAQFALVILLTLFCFKHLLYDYVVLLVPLAVILKAEKSTERTIALLGILYFWFVSTIINRFEVTLHAPTVIFSSVILSITIFCVIRLMANPSMGYIRATD